MPSHLNFRPLHRHNISFYGFKSSKVFISWLPWLFKPLFWFLERSVSSKFPILFLFHSGFERKVIIFKLQGVPPLACYALPEFEVNNDVDKHVDSELIVTFFFTIKRNIFVFFRRLRGLRYWTGLTDCQREEFTSWVLRYNLQENNTISISAQTLMRT